MNRGKSAQCTVSSTDSSVRSRVFLQTTASSALPVTKFGRKTSLSQIREGEKEGGGGKESNPISGEKHFFFESSLEERF